MQAIQIIQQVLKTPLTYLVGVFVEESSPQTIASKVRPCSETVHDARDAAAVLRFFMP